MEDTHTVVTEDAWSMSPLPTPQQSWQKHQTGMLAKNQQDCMSVNQWFKTCANQYYKTHAETHTHKRICSYAHAQTWTSIDRQPYTNRCYDIITWNYIILHYYVYVYMIQRWVVPPYTHTTYTHIICMYSTQCKFLHAELGLFLTAELNCYYER